MATEDEHEPMATYVVTPLYFSRICRLCATENADGIYLYDNDSDLKAIINKYLPVTVDDDGKLPRTICPGCHIQLASTKQFFDLLVEGQSNLRGLWTQEITIQKGLEREKQIFSELEGNSKVAFLKDGNVNENEILIRIYPDDQLFPDNHEMPLSVSGVEKPRRKRGRPRKPKPSLEPTQSDQVDSVLSLGVETLESDGGQDPGKEDEDDDFGDENGGRRRRRRKPPQRFMETVAGKELDRVLREEGAIDGFESDDSLKEEQEPSVEVRLEDLADSETLDANGGNGEIIGHLTAPDGSISGTIVAPPSNRGPYRKRKPHKFVCDYCNQAFRERTKWIRHRISHKGLRFQCSDISCLLSYTSRNKLTVHQAVAGHTGMEIVEAEEDNATNQSQFACESCDRSFDSAAELAAHEATHSPKKMENDCTVKPDENVNENEEPEKLENCDVSEEKGEATPTKLTQGKHQCDECNRSFNHSSSLVYHKESKHNGGRRFVCVKCNKSFNHKQLLQRHQMVHSDLRPFSCLKCGMSFKTKSNLFNHRVVHTGEKRFSCETCGQQFAHKTSLSLHRSWHQGIRPFKCEFCSKCFTQSGNLREHMRIHNGEKPYKCTYCGKAFTTSSQQRLHLKRHTGDRPWKCQYCSKPFLHKDTWKTHERRHTGEKPFNCSYCNRGFAEHWSLKKHIRLHTGEKPYKCDTCGKEFADCSNLTKHKKVHSVQNSTLEQNQVWNLIKSQLNTGPDSNEHVIFVTYGTDAEEKDGPEIKEIVEQQSLAIEDAADSQSAGDTVNFLDEEGNPAHILLPDGKTVEVVSYDTDNNVVQLRTSEGWIILLQMPQNRKIVEEEMIEHIRLAVAEATANELQHVTSEDQAVMQSDEVVGSDSEPAFKLENMTGGLTASEQATAHTIQLQLEDPADGERDVMSATQLLLSDY